MKARTVLGRALLLALGLTACSASSNPTAGVPGAGTPTASAREARSATATNGIQANNGIQAETPSTVSTAAATYARRGRCVSSVLRATLGQGEGAAGHFYVAVLLTNRGRVACTLTGYPGVSFTAGAHARRIGAPALRDHRYAVRPVLLVPGGTVHATLAIANYANYDPLTCRPAPATGYRIYPPGSTGSLLIRAPQTVCSRWGVQSFQTSVVRPGTSPD